MESGDLFYEYQPTVALSCGKVCGAEALMRWDRNGETIYPDHFIPLAEQTSLAADITNAMIPALIRDMQIIERDSPGLVTAFNACAQECIDGEMTNVLVQAIADGKIRPGSLRVEVTETHLAENIGRLHDQFQILIDAGVKLAMDDLGKGYSSLDLLSKLPFTCLKIDKGIVSAMGMSSKAHHIIESICDLSAKIGVTLIAEGVESRKTYMDLDRMGCHQAQGYWIGKPMSLEEYLDFVRNHRLWGIEKVAA